jgi:hypothetical protein
VAPQSSNENYTYKIMYPIVIIVFEKKGKMKIRTSEIFQR